jgi:hypothetical protein
MLILPPPSYLSSHTHPCTHTGGNTSIPWPCGDSSWYCPARSASALRVSAGYYSLGVAGSKSNIAQCPLGQYCNGTGIPYDCPAGTYGAIAGLSTDFCSGRCIDGALCEPQSVSPNGQPCHEGYVCVQGIPQACPTGTYNPTQGASNLQVACLPCPAATFNPIQGGASAGACLPCSQFEGSAPGASLCWPGLRGG